jgi:hypothetical protein
MKTKQKKVNTTGLPPVKRFLYSHTVLLTLLIQDGQVRRMILGLSQAVAICSLLFNLKESMLFLFCKILTGG